MCPIEINQQDSTDPTVEKGKGVLEGEGQGEDEGPLLKLLRSALMAHKQGNQGQAIQLYEMCLQSDPENPMVLRLLGQLLNERKEYGQALPLLRKAVERSPNDPAPFLQLGHCLAGLDSLAEAVAAFEESRRLDPNQENIDFQIGRCHALNRQVDTALLHFAAQIEKKPRDAQLSYRMGRLLIDCGRLDKGPLFIQRALILDPELLGMEIPKPEAMGKLIRKQKTRPPTYLPAETGEPSVEAAPFACFSYPKCGTHLLSDIMQLATGRDFFWPDDYRSNDVPGDALTRVPDNHFLVGHWHPNPEFCADMLRRSVRAIVQYRDPRDQVVSFYFYYLNVEGGPGNFWTDMLKSVSKEQGLNHLIAGVTVPSVDDSGKERNIQSPGMPMNMAVWMGQWRESGVPVQFVSFDEMVADKVGTIGRLAAFLDAPLSRERCEEIAEVTGFKKKSATLEKSGGPKNFKRKGVAGDWRNHFTEANKVLFKAVTGDLLQLLGLEEDNQW